MRKYLRNSKNSYFENQHIKNLKGNRTFWGNVKPLFSNKVRPNVHITGSENDQLIRDEYKLANISNNFFINIAPNFGIKIGQHYICNSSNISRGGSRDF